MNSDLTHEIEIKVSGIYGGAREDHFKVRVAGDGSLAHILSSFNSLLASEGYSILTKDNIV